MPYASGVQTFQPRKVAVVHNSVFFQAEDGIRDHLT